MTLWGWIGYECSMARCFTEKEGRRGELLGPRLTAPVAYQKGACHMSVETIRRFFLDVCEGIWTVLATCAQQGRSAFKFLYHSIIAYFTDQPFPSLLPLPP